MLNKKILITSLSLILNTSAFAFPRGCENNGHGFDREYLVLNTNNQQTLFLIQNTGKNTVEFEHVETKSEIFMSPKLESKLAPNQWSAFSSDIQNFYFKCMTTQDDGSKRQINCQEFLSICQYPRAQFPLSNKGNYWISTNKELTQVIKESASKGIYLKW